MTRPRFDLRIGRLRPWLGRLRRVADPSLMAWRGPRWRTLVAHLAALTAAAIVVALQGVSVPAAGDEVVAFVIAGGFAALRTLAVTKRLAPSTLMLDAVGMVLFLTGTGAPLSPFYAFALAGVWWAAHVPRRHSGVVYGVTFAGAYGLLAMPQALDQGLAVEAFEDAAALVIVALLSDWFVRVDRRALMLNEALTVPPFGAEQLAIREGLLRALRTMDIPVDVVLAAGQVGLTAVQAELLAYLVLGLTNIEISDAVGVSEATVRYRLTRLYRVLGVRGRKGAASRARALGLSPPDQGPQREPRAGDRT